MIKFLQLTLLMLIVSILIFIQKNTIVKYENQLATNLLMMNGAITANIASKLGYIDKSVYEKLVTKNKELEQKLLNLSDNLPPNAIVGKCYAKCKISSQYETVEEDILVKKGYRGGKVTYKTVTEEILLTPATTQWIKGKIKKGTDTYPDDCEAWSLVEFPAKYQTITKKVLDKKKSDKNIKPAPRYNEYITITKKELVSTGRVIDMKEIDCANAVF